MENLKSILITGIGFAVLVSGLITFVILAPSPRKSRSESFLKRSFVSSFIVVFSMFFFILALDLRDANLSQLNDIWNSFVPMLAYFILGGIILTFLIYIRTVMWKQKDDFMKRWIEDLRNKRK